MKVMRKAKNAFKRRVKPTKKVKRATKTRKKKSKPVKKVVRRVKRAKKWFENLKIKKKSGKIKKFQVEKIIRGVIKAGGSKRLAESVAKNVLLAIKRLRVRVVNFKKVALLVIKELKKKNKKVFLSFKEYFESNLRRKKKAS